MVVAGHDGVVVVEAVDVGVSRPADGGRVGAGPRVVAVVEIGHQLYVFRRAVVVRVANRRALVERVVGLPAVHHPQLGFELLAGVKLRPRALEVEGREIADQRALVAPVFLGHVAFQTNVAHENAQLQVQAVGHVEVVTGRRLADVLQVVGGDARARVHAVGSDGGAVVAPAQHRAVGFLHHVQHGAGLQPQPPDDVLIVALDTDAGQGQRKLVGAARHGRNRLRMVQRVGEIIVVVAIQKSGGREHRFAVLVLDLERKILLAALAIHPTQVHAVEGDFGSGCGRSIGGGFSGRVLRGSRFGGLGQRGGQGGGGQYGRQQSGGQRAAGNVFHRR